MTKSKRDSVLKANSLINYQESRKRGKGTAKDPKERLNVMFAIDSKDFMLAKITGIARESHKEVDQIVPYFTDVKAMVTDDNVAYKKYALSINAEHIQINSQVKYDPKTHETLNNVNGLMFEFDLYMAKFKGVSSRHLSSYIDSFFL